MENVDDQDSTGAQQSTFVTVVAWIFIVLTGFASFISVFQNIMVWTMFSEEQFNKVPDNEPAVFKFFFWNPKLFFLFFLFFCVFTFVSSLGLLRRKNWARICFICIMGLGIAWMIFGIVLQWTVFSGSNMPHDDRFGAMVTMIKIMSIVMAVGIGVLFGWIIKKLRSSEIKKEFTATGLESF